MPRTTKRPAIGSEDSSRPKTLKRRKELLGVVYEAVSEHGVDGVTMRQIGEAAGISTGTINYHFKNKYNLLIAALGSRIRTSRKIGKSTRGRRSPNCSVWQWDTCLRAPRDRFWRFWINYTAHGTRDDEMRRHQNDRYERQLKFWGSLLRDGITAGEVDQNVDPIPRPTSCF